VGRADVLAPREEQLDAARAWWHLGFRLEVLTRAVGQAKGVPFVVTSRSVVRRSVRSPLLHGPGRAVPADPWDTGTRA